MKVYVFNRVDEPSYEETIEFSVIASTPQQAFGLYLTQTSYSLFNQYPDDYDEFEYVDKFRDFNDHRWKYQEYPLTEPRLLTVASSSA